MLRFPYTARRDNKPGPKGVRKIRDKFIGQVHQRGKRFHLGTFPTEWHAALAVNFALGVLFLDLPQRYLNDIPPEFVPSPEDQKSIEQEVRLRLGVADPTKDQSLAPA